MTKEDFETFKRVYKEAVEERAFHIAKIFKDYDSDFETANWWELEEDNTFESGFRVYCSSCGMFNDTEVSYDAKWLYATDEELKQHVQSILDERRRKREELERRKKAEEEIVRRENIKYFKSL